jgi:uncharacterized surface protein with fasciclin (FAS1) repeats
MQEPKPRFARFPSMTMRLSAGAALIALAIAAAPPAFAQTGERFLILIEETAAPEAVGDVIDAAAANGQFTRFLRAVEAAGYEETLRGEGPFTIFAPTDDAFARMDQREVERLMLPANRDELLAFLAFHVVPERVTAHDVRGRVERRESASGFRVTLDGRDGLRVDDRLVVVPDVEASNGVIHGINEALTPPVLIVQTTQSAAAPRARFSSRLGD